MAAQPNPIVITAGSLRLLRRLRHVCQRAGLEYVAYLIQELPEELYRSHQMALVGLHEDDLPLLPTIQQRCDGLSLILAGSPETVDLALQSFPELSPDGLLLEPFTAQHLRALFAWILRNRRHRTASNGSHSLWNLLDSIPEAVIVTDQRGHIRYCNRAVQRLTGWSLERLHQSSIEDLFALASEYQSPSFAERVVREGNVELDLQLRSQQQKPLTVHGTVTPLWFPGDDLNALLWFLRTAEVQESDSQQSLHLQQLFPILESLLELRPMEELLSTTVQTLFSLLPLDLAALYAREGDLLLSRWYATSSPESTALVRSPLPVEHSLIGSTLCRGFPAVFNNAHQHPHSYYPEGSVPPAVEHLISIPLRVGSQQAALALARFANPPFSAREVELAVLFGRFVQIGLVNAELWQSLQRSEVQYRELLEWLPAPLILHREEKVLYANQAAANILGFPSPQDLVGLSVVELVTPEERSTFREWTQNLYHGQHPTVSPRYTRLLHRSGSQREVLVSARIVTYEGLPAVLTVGVDVTEQRRLQRQREWELAALRIVATAALHSQSISELCEYFLVQACQELGFSDGSIRLLEGNDLVPVAITGLPPDAVPTVPLTDEDTLAAFVARTRQPIFVPDIELYPLSESHRQRLCELGLRAALSYPIVGTQGQLLGTFQLAHHAPLDLGEDAREFFAILASSLGIAIERLRLEQQLRDSEYRFRTLAEHAPIAITRYSLHEGRYLFANREFERQSGYALAEFEALSDHELIEMIYPEDRERVFRFWREWQRAGFPDVQRIDYRIYNRSGEVVWLDSYLYAERRSDGQLESIVQVCIDITPLKQAEEALRRALQEDFRRTVQNLHGIVFRLQRRSDGTVFYALREGKLAGSYTTATIYGRSIDELPEPLRFPLELLERAFVGERVTIEVAHDDRWLLYTLEPLYSDSGTVVEVVGTGVDITERRLLERSLADSEHRYRSLLEALPVGVMEIFVSADFSRQGELYVNPAFTAITGYALEELSTISGAATVHPEDRAKVEEAWAKWFNTPDAPPLRLEYRCLRKNGEPYWLELLAVKVRQHDGWRIIEVGTDVTERKRAEEHIQYLANFSELSPIPIVEMTPDGIVTYANPAAHHLLPVHELSPVHPWLEGIWKQLPAMQQLPEKPWIREVVLGEHAWLQHIFWLPTYQRLRIYAPEITLQHHLRRQLQEALEHEQELAVARSRLMSTIAHEFRTPLAGIQFSVELLQNYFDRLSAAERQQELRNIAARVHDLSTLVADFLTQSSLDALRRSLAFEPVLLQTVCQEATERIQPLLTAKAQKLLMELPEQPVYVRGDPKVLRFVLLNLLTNASKYSGMNQSIHLRLRVELGTAVVEVEDRGIGIPEEELPQLFQPFFRGSNTRGIPGIGLGLTLVKEFTELHRGSIHIRSRLGSGTLVTLRFPIAESL